MPVNVPTPSSPYNAFVTTPVEAIPDLCLTIPVYNESANLGALRERIAAACRRLQISYRLLWIDDCSTDNSREIIRQFNQDDPERDHFIFRKENMGICYAWRDSFAQRGRIVGLIPSDGQFAPENLDEVLEAFRDGCEALVITRPKRSDKALRFVVSRIARILERVFMGNPYRDIHWVHFWRGGLLDGLAWHSTTTAIDAEWSYQVRRRVPCERITVLGLPHYPRSTGKATAGKANMNMLLLNLYTFADLMRASVKIFLGKFL